MANETQICKFALSLLEIGQTIESIDESTNAARICSLWYGQSRDEVLRAFPWDFAFRAEALALVSDQTFPGYAYVYQYPQNCLRVLDVGPSGGTRISALNAFYTPPYESINPQPFRFPWKLALKSDGASNVILCDLPEAWAYFTGRVTNTSVFAADVTALIAMKLATYIGAPLKVDPQKVAQIKALYEQQLVNTKATAHNESRDEPRPESPSILARL